MGLLSGCSQAEEESYEVPSQELSFEQMRVVASKYVHVKNNHYVLELSLVEAGNQGLSVSDYKKITQYIEGSNTRIEALENKYKGDSIIVINPQSKQNLSSIANQTKSSMSDYPLWNEWECSRNYGRLPNGMVCPKCFGMICKPKGEMLGDCWGGGYTGRPCKKCNGIGCPPPGSGSAAGISTWLSDRIIERGFSGVENTQIPVYEPVNTRYDVLEIDLKSSYIATVAIKFCVSFTHRGVTNYLLGNRYTFSGVYYWDALYDGGGYGYDPLDPMISLHIRLPEWQESQYTNYEDIFIAYIVDYCDWPASVRFRMRDCLIYM